MALYLINYTNEFRCLIIIWGVNIYFEFKKIYFSMNLYQRYRKLTIWNKLGVWAAIITILSFVGYFLYPQFSNNKSNQANINTNSNGNVVIQSSRDVIINSPLTTGKVVKDSSKNKLLNKSQNKIISNKDSSKISVGPNSVISVNQQGGQTANTINNITVNSSDRFIPPNIASVLKEHLSKFNYKSVSIRIANNDVQSDEPVKFAEELNNIFSLSGWNNTLSNSGNMIANGVVTKGVIINAIGDSNIQIADFIRSQFIPLGYRISCKYYSTDYENKDLYIEIWTK